MDEGQIVAGYSLETGVSLNGQVAGSSPSSRRVDDATAAVVSLLRDGRASRRGGAKLFTIADSGQEESLPLITISAQ